MRHFKSKEAYRKWLAYGHMRSKSGKLAKRKSETIFSKIPGHQKVVIRGKPHKVKHSHHSSKRKLKKDLIFEIALG